MPDGSATESRMGSPQNVGNKSVEERLNEMDARLRRLEPALDTVLKKLDGK